MHVCGVDIGSTNLKVAIVDAAGFVVWTKAVPTPRMSQDRNATVDAGELLRTIEDLMIEGWRVSCAGLPLQAITTTGVGEDGIFINRTLTPLGPAIAWYDRRAFSEAAEIRASAAATPLAGMEMDDTRTGAKWLWLSRHQPDLFTSAYKWVALTDYPCVVWSGEPFMSESLASRTGCYDVAKRMWIADLLALCGSPALPPVRHAGDCVGTMRTGRLTAAGVASPRTLLVAGGHDHPVAAALIQRIDPSARVDSIGTANVIYGETSSFDLDRFDPYLAFMVPVRAAAGLACLGVYEFSSAVQALQSKGTDIRATLALSRIPGEPMSHLTNARSVLEMAGMTARRMFDHMRLAGVPDGDIYATGGWSRSRSLLELRASIFGEPIKVLSLDEPAVVGAALLAAEALPQGVNFLSAITTHTADPDPRWAEIYEQHYQTALHRLNPPDRLIPTAPTQGSQPCP
ncbi:hypothetical protein IFT84_07820 [Rhizobium sp. CFBP 8762]|uniref:FGGY-family carbohydrate kinase n=1 Tax=Rhizobium sp. CFBP 8762 TaxID=2775279 RepID=UPI001783EB9D|nr:FGGY family carbohydrate kinase [Rhizobium sp. CFBP 8762]MBD8554435.1 hypothetical protein [Rhizobium sp. CFBP 8762]